MNRELIKKYIQEVLSLVMNRTVTIESENVRLLSDLGLESIDIVDFLFEMEDRTGLLIDLADLNEELQKDGSRFNDFTIGQLIEYILMLEKK